MLITITRCPIGSEDEVLAVQEQKKDAAADDRADMGDDCYGSSYMRLGRLGVFSLWHNCACTPATISFTDGLGIDLLCWYKLWHAQ